MRSGTRAATSGAVKPPSDMATTTLSVPPLDGRDDAVGIGGEPGRRVVGRQVDGGGRVAGGRQHRDDPAPVPRSTAGPGYQHEMGHGQSRHRLLQELCGGFRHDDELGAAELTGRPNEPVDDAGQRGSSNPIGAWMVIVAPSPVGIGG